jgi:hypothetical protein
LTAARLVTADTGTVEISHEAVLTAWPLLRAWVDSDRAGLVIGRRLRDAAHSWWHDGFEGLLTRTVAILCRSLAARAGLIRAGVVA